MTRTRTRAALAALALVTAATAAGCAVDDQTQLDDAPVGELDDVPQKVLTNLDQFPNIAVRCYGANGVYTTTRDYGDALTIVVNDPECPGFDPAGATVVSG